MSLILCHNNMDGVKEPAKYAPIFCYISEISLHVSWLLLDHDLGIVILATEN